MLEAGIKPVYGVSLAYLKQLQHAFAPAEALSKAPPAGMSLMASLRL